MSISLSQLLEDSFQIAWEFLERTDELGDAAAASRFLSDTIETMIRRGQRNRLALSNRAISAYQRFRISGATDTKPGARSSAWLASFIVIEISKSRITKCQWPTPTWLSGWQKSIRKWPMC
jgi:hypothetical protein